MTPIANGNFSGGGFLEVGLAQEGIEFVQSQDIDPKATASMKRNPQYFPHNVVTADIRMQTVAEQPDADIIVGTYPCTKYSAIADIHGTRTGDDLFLHFFRMLAIKQPEVYVMENVPGMRKFPVVMEAMSKLPGYYVNIFCPIDAALWLPQRRERLILVGTRRPFTVNAPTAPKVKPRIKDILEKNPVYDMPDYVLRRLNGKYRDLPIIVDPKNPDAIAPTCVAHYAKDLGTRLVKDKKAPHGVRPFTIREWARLMGIPDDYLFENVRHDYQLIGNGVPPPIGRWIATELKRYFN
jgi:DNA (cytosine-5)-methyltransferase 1